MTLVGASEQFCEGPPLLVAPTRLSPLTEGIQHTSAELRWLLPSGCRLFPLMFLLRKREKQAFFRVVGVYTARPGQLLYSDRTGRPDPEAFASAAQMTFSRRALGLL